MNMVETSDPVVPTMGGASGGLGQDTDGLEHHDVSGGAETPHIGVNVEFS